MSSVYNSKKSITKTIKQEYEHQSQQRNKYYRLMIHLYCKTQKSYYVNISENLVNMNSLLYVSTKFYIFSPYAYTHTHTHIQCIHICTYMHIHVWFPISTIHFFISSFQQVCTAVSKLLTHIPMRSDLTNETTVLMYSPFYPQTYSFQSFLKLFRSAPLFLPPSMLCHIFVSQVDIFAAS